MHEILKQTRLNLGYDISDIAKQLYIKEEYLIALEENNFDVIPGKTYVNGYLKLYANYLGVNLQNTYNNFNVNNIINDQNKNYNKVNRYNFSRIIILLSFIMLLITYISYYQYYNHSNKIVLENDVISVIETIDNKNKISN